MSWLSGLSGRAEEFLNKLDQSAAQALHKEEENKLNLSLPITSDNVSTPKQSASTRPFSQTASQSVPPKLSSKVDPDSASSFVSTPIKPTRLQGTAASGTVPKQQAKTSAISQSETVAKNKVSDQSPPLSGTGSTKKKLDTDAALFDFLNSSEPLDSAKKKSTPASSTRHSRQSSTSSVVSNKGGKTNSETPVSTNESSIVHVESLPSASGSERGSPSEPDGLADVAAIADAMLEQSPSNSVDSHHDGDPHREMQQKVSSLELENKLLRNEVASLNQEMASVLQRSRESHTDLEKLQRRIDDHNRTASQSDQLVRELQSRESDLLESLQAKDSQLAVLRVRLEEADKHLESKQKSVHELQEQKERILKDHSDSSGVHGQALDSLRCRLTEMENSLRLEQTALKTVQQEANDRQEKLEQEQRSLAEALKAAERKANEEKAKTQEMQSQLKTAKSNMEAAKQELSDYKEKATRILQSKERLIASLREGSGASGESMGVSHLEYDSVKQERDMFREELQQSRMTVDNLKVELSDLETQLQQDSDRANEQIQSLEENIADEKRRREDAEMELLKQKQELQYALEESRRQKTSYQTCVSDREAEIEKLRNQIMTKSMSSTTENELESRVKTLTESLIQKQTVLETLSTEKNSLTLQLERMEQQYKDVKSSSLRTNTTVVNVNDEDEVRQRLPAFMREAPTDTEVTKKMKMAANTLDRFSIRIGVFLRRYPMTRVFILIYMIILHLWVMVVLLTYQPEMHGADFGQPHAPPRVP